MSKSRIHAKNFVFLFVFVLSVMGLLQSQFHSSAQTNVCPGNVVANGTFTGSVSPWSAAYGTPDWGAPGQVGMWGNMNPSIGEGLKQTLTLVSGVTYNGTISYRIAPGSDKQPNGRIRIRLSAAALTQWGTVDTIDLSPMTAASATVWTTEPFSFTATASSQVLTINVENMLSANDGTKTSYGVIDNVCIQPAPTPGVPASVCVGQLATFTGSAASSWNWNFGDGGTSMQQNPTHAYATAGTFPVKLCVNGTTNCVTKNIIVNALPQAPVITGPASSCGNQTATYSVPAVAGYSYSWSVTNGTINGSSTAASVSVTWNTTGVGVIGVTVTNKAGCSITVRKEVIGCDSHLPCCKDFAAKTDLKSLTNAGNNTYNFTPTLSVNQPGPYVRVTADIIGANVTYSTLSCGQAGPIVATIAGASPNPAGFNSTIPISGGHEVIWYGSGANVNGVDFPIQIALPPGPTGNCIQYVTICIKYTFTNKDCKTCEVIRCYSFRRGGPIKDLTEFTEIKSQP